MGKLFCIIGKSGAGKDTVLSGILNKNISLLKPVVTYTTRPKRKNETEGKEYHFVNDSELTRLDGEGRVIEKRTYHTVYGDWHYFTCHIDISGREDYIMIGTPDVVDKLYEHYDSDRIIVIYLQLDEKERLLRCINRESQQKVPNYSEVCRRYLADEKDFFKGRLENYTHLFSVDSGRSTDENVLECLNILRATR